MEQYKNNGDEPATISKTERQMESNSISSTNQDCFGGQRCSGYGQCSSSKKKKSNVIILSFVNILNNFLRSNTISYIQYTINSHYYILLDSFLQPQITMLKPKGKSLPNVSQPCKDDTQIAATASRSLSTLTERSSKKSKNTSKGASGNKIDTGGKKFRINRK